MRETREHVSPNYYVNYVPWKYEDCVVKTHIAVIAKCVTYSRIVLVNPVQILPCFNRCRESYVEFCMMEIVLNDH